MVSLKKIGLRKCSNILNEATEKGRKEIVELLLDKSANVNIRKQDGSTALHSGSSVRFLFIENENFFHFIFIFNFIFKRLVEETLILLRYL
jgi:hypothetical protein